MARGISGVSVDPNDSVPDTQQRVYYANHTSNLDFPVLWAVLPLEVRARTRPVAALDYWLPYAPLRYLAQNLFRAILIERHHVTRSNHPITQILTSMGEHDSIVIFPEGSRSTDPTIRPFKSGLYHLGKKRPSLEMVPVYLDNLNRVWPKGKFFPVPLLASIHFGSPLRVEPGEQKSAFLERARRALSTIQNRRAER